MKHRTTEISGTVGTTFQPDPAEVSAGTSSPQILNVAAAAGTGRKVIVRLSLSEESEQPETITVPAVATQPLLGPMGTAVLVVATATLVAWPLVQVMQSFRTEFGFSFSRRRRPPHTA
ncbi:MAG: hypothetical protein K0U34_06650 [Alphaproteobacteria bacterium]|nr:hypothetical protein [Alphaproteobacteria bacterium]